MKERFYKEVAAGLVEDGYFAYTQTVPYAMEITREKVKEGVQLRMLAAREHKVWAFTDEERKEAEEQIQILSGLVADWDNVEVYETTTKVSDHDKHFIWGRRSDTEIKFTVENFSTRENRELEFRKVEN